MSPLIVLYLDCENVTPLFSKEIDLELEKEATLAATTHVVKKLPAGAALGADEW